MDYIDFMFVLIYLMFIAGMKTELEKQQDQRTKYKDFDSPCWLSN